MNTFTPQELRDKMYRVIEQEQLPRPERIQLRAPIMGAKTRQGSCIRFKHNNSFRITVALTKTKFCEDPEGRYRNRITGVRLRRMLGVKMEPHEILHTAAHEIAHLRFWNHNAEHHTYTEYILKLLKKELGWTE